MAKEFSFSCSACGLPDGGLDVKGLSNFMFMSAAKVAETMSVKITSMNHGQGFAANLATGVLVILASLYGLPVSTTHVSVGALAGIGLTQRKANIKVLRGIVLSWVITLPCAAFSAAFIWWVTARF